MTNLREQEHENETFYPARLEDVLCVGGMVPECGVTPDEGNCGGDPLWATTPASYGSADGVQGPYCSQKDCEQNGACQSNRQEVWWEDNVQSVGANPDILAPVHYFGMSKQRGYTFKCGTSYAAPLVTGVLASLWSDAQRMPSPSELTKSVSRMGEMIDDGTNRKFNAKRAKRSFQ